MRRPASATKVVAAARPLVNRVRRSAIPLVTRIRRNRGEENSTAILDSYIRTSPSAQNAIDLFDGEWSSHLPEETGLVSTPGPARLFDDERIHWAAETFGGFAGMRVLELGPLEAGHSFMLDRGGAKQVDAIEANTRAFLKCLVVKESLGLPSVNFHLGDFMKFVAEPIDEEGVPRCYDLAVASGVLYHLLEPVEFLAAVSLMAERIFIWTHYVDDDHVPSESEDGRRIGPIEERTHGAHAYSCATQSYGGSLGWAGFCGGPESESRWLTRSSLLGIVADLGYTDIEIGFDDRNHPNGPSIAICASKRSGESSAAGC